MSYRTFTIEELQRLVLTDVEAAKELGRRMARADICTFGGVCHCEYKQEWETLCDELENIPPTEEYETGKDAGYKQALEDIRQYGETDPKELGMCSDEEDLVAYPDLYNKTEFEFGLVTKKSIVVEVVDFEDFKKRLEAKQETLKYHLDRDYQLLRTRALVIAKDQRSINTSNNVLTISIDQDIENRNGENFNITFTMKRDAWENVSDKTLTLKLIEDYLSTLRVTGYDEDTWNQES